MNLAELAEPLDGRDAWRAGVEMIERAFLDLDAGIEEIFAAGDRVAVRLTLRGTHEGEYLGVAPTGRSIAYVGREFHRVAGGVTAADTATLFRQLG